MHPLIDEICRAKEPPTRMDVLRRWQHELRHQVQPLLDELDALRAQAAEKPSKRDKDSAA